MLLYYVYCTYVHAYKSKNIMAVIHTKMEAGKSKGLRWMVGEKGFSVPYDMFDAIGDFC